MKNLMDNHTKFTQAVILLFGCISIIFLLWIQLTNINPFAATWDQVDFALALERYDLMAMQPHFPGYPYFILGGYLIHAFIEDKAASLTVFNILVYLSALYPMYKLTRQYLDKSYSVLTASIFYSSTYIMVMVNQPISEGAAIAALWWYFWSLSNALKNNRLVSNLLPAFLLSIVLGIRLSYLPFAVGLFFLLYSKWRNKHYQLKHIFMFSLAACLFQFVWLTALVVSEGSIKGFIKLSLAFTGGHFNSWGNTAVSDHLPFLSRVKLVALNNVIWTGLTSQTIVLGVLYAILFILFIYHLKQKEFPGDPIQQLALLMGGSYFIWAFLAQNADKPRHILPITVFILFIIVINVLKRTRNFFSIVLIAVILVSQVIYSAVLIKQQATEDPSTIKLAKYLQSVDQSTIIYTWEETRVFEYVNLPITHKRIQTYEFFLHDISYYQKNKILITDKAVKGFKSQGAQISGKIKKVKAFKSNPLFDRVYSDITVYEWIR
jgi:hypothetical protein